MSLVLSPVKGVQFSTDMFFGQSRPKIKGENMELIKELVVWFSVNGPALVGAILGLLAVAETITRLTPTKKDDTAVERIGGVIRKFFDMLGVPNKKAGGGDHETKSEKEEKNAA